jgi:spore coat polysaccharide biosynthesis predicted glycosyltransferase SpsG
MKVFILTEGGEKIGFGHITRCISLYQAFEEKGITPELIINGDDRTLGLLQHKNYHIINWLKEKNKLLEIIDTATSVIIDSYLASKPLYDRVSQRLSGKLIIIDDFNRLEYPKGIVVNPSIYGDKLSYPKKNGATYLLGKEYIILRKEFWDIPPKKINKKVKNVLITFGGMSHYNLAYRIVSYFKNRFDFHFDIVDTRKNRFTAREMLNLMLKADICISGGGQTTYELARVGVPTIGICFAENQRFNLEGWQEKGFIEYIGQYNDENLFSNLFKSINKLGSYKERAKRHKIVNGLIDGRGVKRIIKKVITEN